ncbi:hypothetical protein J19TS2_18960 [Cohnella xylanilytica]|uniref:nuclear transport factor 2 family protein n=1 Tax=Cohnella xylanilytica TaxID=557555 RepID=UPI001B1D7E8D|nr:nuclear transport factor 2 family protein [Cohnella xylanilytica]GIO12341.1 hypothetical protein J19TS2_18960 [Cohnella xylanilytica]
MNDNEMSNLITSYIEAYNDFDVEGMLRLLHEKVVFRNISNGVVDTETKGIEEFRMLAEQSAKLFAQRRQTIKEMTIDGDRAEIEIEYEGTPAIDLPNGLKAGETIRLGGKSIFYVKNGKIIVLEDHS